MMTEEELYNLMQAANEQRATAPRGQERDVRGENLKAFGRAFARGASVGHLEKALANPLSGDSYAGNLEKEFNTSEMYSRQNPWVTPAGEIAGSTLTSALGITGIGKLGKVAKPVVKPLGNALAATDTIVGRTLKAMGMGAGEGALYAAGQNESLLSGALTGGGAGGAGQLLLGEVVPAAFRGLTGSKGGKVRQAQIEQQAKNAVLTILRSKNPGLADEKISEELAKMMTKLGPRATIADLDNALYDRGLASILDRGDVDASQKWIQAVAGRSEDVQKRFRGVVIKAMGGNKVPHTKPQHEIYMKDMADKYRPDFEAAVSQPGAVHSVQDLDAIFKDVLNYRDSIGKQHQAYVGLNKQVKSLLSKRTKGKVDLDTAELSSKDILNLRQYVDEVYDDAVNPMSTAHSKGLAKDMAKLRDELTSILEDDFGEAFKKANSQYSELYRYSNARSMGETFLNPSTVAEDYTAFLETASPEQLRGFIEGAQSRLYRTLLSANGDDKIARATAQSEGIRQKLRLVFPERVADGIIDRAQELANFKPNDAKVAAARDKAVGVDPRGFDLSGGVDLLTAVGGLLTPHISSAAGIGGARRLVNQVQGVHPRVEEDFMGILANQGPEALQRLFKNNKAYEPAASDYLGLPFMGAGVTTDQQR